MAEEKKKRDKAAEKAVKERLKRTHLKYCKTVGSEKGEEVSVVYLLRTVGVDNYVFKVNCTKSGASFDLSGLIPVTEDFGEYRVYNPKPACADALRPTDKEKTFTG